jgi:hypothetical protein
MTWTLNGTAVASPDYPLGGGYNNLDSSESRRLENGKIFIKRIRTGVVSMDIKWSHLSSSEASTILSVINNDNIIIFTCSYPDPRGQQTKNFYAADTTYQQVGQDDWSIQTSFVEE